ncbi:MAG: alpha-hydroxy-acid oxidizing protein [Bryobacterales bacterium]|nr:alpha-hydroxy-acid oxidizing protein [Bryobacterales bacterium]
MNRRDAFRNLAAFFAASPLTRGQQDIPDTRERYPALDELVNVFEFEPLCKSRIPKPSYDNIAGGVDNEWSLRHNREAFDRISFRPRVLVNTSRMDLSTTLFGTNLAFPVLIAPTAGHQQAHPQGELATARAAAAAKTVMCVSNNSSYSLEKVAEATNAAKWWQLYPAEDDEATRGLVNRAVSSGYKVIVVTVDVPYLGHRERPLRDAPRAPAVRGEGSRSKRAEEAPAHPYGLQARPSSTWDWTYLARVKDWAKTPVLVKGILTGEDAELAVTHGADGVVVSNHGGRLLDYAPATIDVLPEVVQAAGKKIPVIVDSGFRRGTDILKALAIGASAVQIGRPVLWGLGAYGQPGVEKVLQLLETELALAMGLCGKATIGAIDKSLIRMER